MAPSIRSSSAQTLARSGPPEARALVWDAMHSVITASLISHPAVPSSVAPPLPPVPAANQIQAEVRFAADMEAGPRVLCFEEIEDRRWCYVVEKEGSGRQSPMAPVDHNFIIWYMQQMPRLWVHASYKDDVKKIVEGFGISYCHTYLMKRLRVAEEENTNVVAMSVFWLVPQFMILGLGDGFTLVGLQEYFNDQVPETMRSLGIAFFLSVIGASNFLSGFLITVVDHLSEEGGKASWFAKDLNRLDYFYWLLAALNGVNLCVFVLLATRFSYKRVQRGAGIADCSEDADVVASRVPV